MKNNNKNNIIKRLLSLSLALSMGAPLTASATGRKDDRKRSNEKFTLVLENESRREMTYEEYQLGVLNTENYLRQFIDYNGLSEHASCLYFIMNIDYISFEASDPQVALNYFMNALSLLNVIADYNQSVIKNVANVINPNDIQCENYDRAILNKYLLRVINDSNYTILNAIYDYNEEIKLIDETKVIKLKDICLSYDARLCEYLTKVINCEDGSYDLKDALTEYRERVLTETYASLIDISEVCYNEKSAELIHDMHVNYFNAYADGLYDSEYFTKLFKQLTTLNAYERAGNACELGVGETTVTLISIGGDTMQLLRDDMQKRFSAATKAKYFDQKELNKGQWILRDDLVLDINNLTDEDLEVFIFGQLWNHVYDMPLNNLYKYIQTLGTSICK